MVKWLLMDERWHIQVFWLINPKCLIGRGWPWLIERILLKHFCGVCVKKSEWDHHFALFLTTFERPHGLLMKYLLVHLLEVDWLMESLAFLSFHLQVNRLIWLRKLIWDLSILELSRRNRLSFVKIGLVHVSTVFLVQALQAWLTGINWDWLLRWRSLTLFEVNGLCHVLASSIRGDGVLTCSSHMWLI